MVQFQEALGTTSRSRERYDDRAKSPGFSLAQHRSSILVGTTFRNSGSLSITENPVKSTVFPNGDMGLSTLAPRSSVSVPW